LHPDSSDETGSSTIGEKNVERAKQMPLADQMLAIDASVKMEACLHSVQDSVLRQHLLKAAADLVDLALLNARLPQRPAEWPLP